MALALEWAFDSSSGHHSKNLKSNAFLLMKLNPNLSMFMPKILILRFKHAAVVAALAFSLVACATPKSATASKPYPLKVCLVTGNDLDSMGDPRVEVYNGRELRFCCKPCVRKFYANPEKYLAKLPR